ncbi:MliC family protein [Gammaproteobacteria bacterium]|nr:MliC family protein [Gammaproteobacteria bacterium]
MPTYLMILPSLIAALTGCSPLTQTATDMHKTDKALVSDLEQVLYRCEDGSTMNVVYHRDPANTVIQLEHDGRRWALIADDSVRGRYDNASIRWQRDGETGTLTDDRQVLQCQQVSRDEPTLSGGD